MNDHLMDIATQQLVVIARTAAYHCDEQHGYMRGAGGNDWFPHKWVVEAMRAAVTIRNTKAEDMVREELHQARAQLAEAHALLRQCGNPVRAQISRLEDEAKRSDHPKLYRDEVERLSVILRQMDALSASAEPSAPKCEDCNDTGYHSSQEPPFLEVVPCTSRGCRAALERKP